MKTWLTGGEPNKGLRDAFAKPPFRVEEAQWLVQKAGIKAMIDISDGLLGDLNHLAQASKVSIVLESNLCFPGMNVHINKIRWYINIICV